MMLDAISIQQQQGLETVIEQWIFQIMSHYMVIIIIIISVSV